MKVDGRSTRFPPALDRVAMKTVAADNGCLVWIGLTGKDGYGRIGYQGRHEVVHRVVWKETVGPIPDGMTIDHLCKNRACVNTGHMEIVTRGENSVRGDGPTGVNSRKTHCVNGHPFDEENTYAIPTGGRACRACQRDTSRRYYWRNQ